MSFADVELLRSVGGLNLEKPLIIASGVWPYEDGLWTSERLEGVGAICSKALTASPTAGNRGHRLWETPCGLLNSIGLQNKGIDDFIDCTVPRICNRGIPVIANVSMEDMDGLEYMLKRLEEVSDLVSAVELNVSCPNVAHGCMSWGVSSSLTLEATRKARFLWRKPLWVKLTPQAPTISEVALAAEEGGADAVVVANTWLGTAIDINMGRPVFDRIVAGLSGPAVFPLSLRLVWEVSNALSIPVIGCGGISSFKDCIAMLMAGASAIEVGTAVFTDLDAPAEMMDGLEEYMACKKLRNLDAVIGMAKRGGFNSNVG